ncbi:MAG: hypothetical protein Q8N94_00035 [Methanoregula sp.]|nr:hypothetical protein [Methanoregula sp.]
MKRCGALLISILLITTTGCIVLERDAENSLPPVVTQLSTTPAQ